MEQNLSATAGQIAVPSIPRMPTVAQVHAVSGQSVLGKRFVPFEAPSMVSV